MIVEMLTGNDYKILIIAETEEGRIRGESLELLSFARQLAQGDLGSILAIVPGDNITKEANALCELSGTDVMALKSAGLRYPNPNLLWKALMPLVGKMLPEYVCFSHNAQNCLSASALAVAMHSSCITAVEEIKCDGGRFLFLRSLFNGKVRMAVRPMTQMKVLTVLPGAGSVVERTLAQGSKGKVTYENSEITDDSVTPCGLAEADKGDASLAQAPVIIAAGRGIGDEKNLDMIRSFVRIFPGAALGASRPLCDQKWLPYSHQVGVTGKRVSPRLYIACGISGSQQHIAGMKGSQCIVAINRDPNAAIFSVADYIVVEDLLSFIPLLLRKHEETNSRS